jgi:ABC-type uncharacterized transport system auxiliary subunit
LVVALAACGGRLPETRYYQLAPTGKATPAPSTGVTLGIQPLDADPAYDDDRIVYRLTPYRLDYYNYHRWSAPPGTLVADYLERVFERSGRFSGVTREASTAPVTLGGRVLAIEEVDQSKTRWAGRIVVELTLTDNTTGDVVWSQQFEETEPLPAQTPEGLAQALSVAMSRIAQRALPQIVALAAKPAPPQEEPTRAARHATSRSSRRPAAPSR